MIMPKWAMALPQDDNTNRTGKTTRQRRFFKILSSHRVV